MVGFQGVPEFQDDAGKGQGLFEWDQGARPGDDSNFRIWCQLRCPFGGRGAPLATLVGHDIERGNDDLGEFVPHVGSYQDKGTY